MLKKTTTTRFFLIRGLGREIRHWGDFPVRLAKAFPQATIHPLEVPGAGRFNSDKAPVDISEYVATMRPEYQRCTRENDHNIVISISFGGMISALWATLYPDDFHHVVLINSSSNLSPLYKRLKPRAALQLLLSQLQKSTLSKEKMIAALLCNLADRAQIANDWTAISETAPVTAANHFRQIISAFRFKLPRMVSIPVLILCSKNDRLVSSDCSKAIAEYWQTDLVFHDRAGHDLPTDDPDWCISQIILWRDIMQNQ